MLALAEIFRAALVPFLIATGAVIGGLLVLLVLQRGLRAIAYWLNDRLQQRYRPLMERLLGDVKAGAPRPALPPRRHRRTIARMLVEPLRVLSGEPIARARAVTDALHLTAMWLDDLGARRWWRRAEAARALGFIGEARAYGPMVALLEDPHEEVRAAAVEALGRIGNVQAAAALLTQLARQSRHQTARILDALGMLGAGAAPDILNHVRVFPEQLPLVSDLIAAVVGSAAMPDLLAWTSAPLAPTRAAAMSALGTIGLDNRTFYYALRALDDPDEDVRAMAARALGRSGRADATEYLTTHLDDTWTVAAHSARALATLGRPGTSALEARAADEGQRGDLARHVLWEQRAARG